MNKKYVVRLDSAERDLLEAIVRKGKVAAYKTKHAHILLKVDAEGPGWSDEKTAEAFGCHLNTVKNVRQRLVEGGLETALERKKQERPSRQPIFDGEKEARLIATSCSQAPEGRAAWTLELLADRMVELEIVESVSPTTVGRTLKKTSCSLIAANAGPVFELKRACQREWRVCCSDGRCVGHLSVGVRRTVSGGVYGRATDATDQRNPAAASL